ncbi:prepilin-type N-terminal cleavage/methylation domain-containing protein [Idiomarina sp. A28L]|uniref:PilW family protein n=1 Tax=Idiomarina sp. A28L TaxID=1036674 RepID=UPI0002138843|nr:type II secretion system protein [Idiomarina sp. A28L]EGN74896.1 prepilin-type N-terminal cleavage/methylation domain-containing protein [Idiomarina sp. A28L]
MCRSQNIGLARGYTLVELIIVMVLLGIVSTFIFTYINFGVRIYGDATGREQLVSQSRFAVERLTRELRNALPRSIRVQATDLQRCVEFVPIVTSSRYLQIAKPGPTSGSDFIAVMPHDTQALENQYLFVYATNINFIYGTQPLRRKTIDSVTENSPEDGLITFSYSNSPSFFPTDSPVRRFYVGGSPVSWCYNMANNTLERYQGYGLTPTQYTQAQLQASFASNREIMAVDIGNDLANDELPFRVFEATLRRNSLVQIDLRFRRSAANEPLQISHEVHIPNVP